MKQKVQSLLDMIRPSVRADGGDVELLGVEGGVVSVRLVGTSRDCPASTMTLRLGVEKFLRKQLPEMKGLIAV